MPNWTILCGKHGCKKPFGHAGYCEPDKPRCGQPALNSTGEESNE